MQEFEQNYTDNNPTDVNSIPETDENREFFEETAEKEPTQEKIEDNQNVQYITVPVFVPVNNLTPEQKEKKDIRRSSMLIAIACLIMTGITYFWSTAYFFVMQAFGFSTERAYLIANDPFVLQVLQIAISSLMFTLPFILVFKIGGYKISQLVALERPDKQSILPLTLIGIGFCSFANISVSVAGSIFEGFGVNYSVDYGEDPKGVLGFIISFIATAIIPALVEEFACRGIILGSLKKYGDGFAVIVSSIIFGLIHGNFEQIPFAFLVGIILGFITVKSGSIWIACLIHSINNAVSVVMSYLPSSLSTEMQNLIYNIYLMVTLLVAIIGAVILAKRRADAFSIKKAETVSGEQEKHRWFFTQPLTVILIIICLLESITHFF